MHGMHLTKTGASKYSVPWNENDLILLCTVPVFLDHVQVRVSGSPRRAGEAQGCRGALYVQKSGTMSIFGDMGTFGGSCVCEHFAV
jgi:hypothetical protein